MFSPKKKLRLAGLEPAALGFLIPAARGLMCPKIGAIQVLRRIFPHFYIYFQSLFVAFF
jgi:hypothetical protein